MLHNVEHIESEELEMQPVQMMQLIAWIVGGQSSAPRLHEGWCGPAAGRAMLRVAVGRRAGFRAGRLDTCPEAPNPTKNGPHQMEPTPSPRKKCVWRLTFRL